MQATTLFESLSCIIQKKKTFPKKRNKSFDLKFEEQNAPAWAAGPHRCRLVWADMSSQSSVPASTEITPDTSEISYCHTFQ